MLNTLDWKEWFRVYYSKVINQTKSLERCGLRNLHREENLNFLRHEIKQFYLSKNIPNDVKIDSVWVDGTPQAEFTTVSGYQDNCELADLLFIIREINNNGKTIGYRGVLLQGKCANTYFRLPGGSSTKTERMLLEQLDRNTDLELYADTQRAGFKIGSYRLGGSSQGLSDCAEYLLMPTSVYWHAKDRIEALKKGPYVVGWPKNLTTNVLSDPKNYLSAILNEMIDTKTMGRDILLNNEKIDRSCPWSAMIDDLLNHYGPVKMKGYDGQNRVYSSSTNEFEALLHGEREDINHFLTIDENGVRQLVSKFKLENRFLDSGDFNTKRIGPDEIYEGPRPLISTIIATVNVEPSDD